MSSARAVVVEGETPAKTLEAGWKILKTQNLILPSHAKILVLIDAPVPEGNPASLNPDSFQTLIKCLQGENPESITILPNTLWDTDPMKNLAALGLMYLFPQLGIQLADFIQYNQDPKKYLQSFTYVVMITQVRVDPGLNLWSSIPSLASFIPLAFRQQISGNDYVAQWIKECKTIFDWKNPDLVINDAFYVLQENGPFIQSNISAIKTQTMIMATDIGVVERITWSFLGLDSEDNTSLRESIKIGFNILQMMEIETNIPVKSGRFKLKFPQIQPTEIFIPNLILCLGTMNDTLQYSLIQLLYSLKSLLLKDAYFMGKWFLLVGENPPLPGNSYPIVLFGDEAIQSTEQYEFRKLIETKKVYSTDELDTLIYRNDSIMRDKVLKLEEYNRILQEKIQEKEDPLDREEAVIRANKNKEKKILKLKHKQVNFALKMRKQNEQAQIQNLVPKVRLNQRILEIPGNPPSARDCLSPLAFFWTSQETPTLRQFVTKTEDLYHYMAHKTRVIDRRWKNQKKLLQRQIKVQFSPIKKEESKKLQELRQKYKTLTKNEKSEFQKAMKIIDTKYAPLIGTVKKKRDQLRLEKKLNKKSPQEVKSSLQEEKNHE